jgi:hypothetical protein
MAEENFDIFSDFQEQDFANSQEYFDYLTKQSEDYRDFATNPEKVKKDRETFFNQTTDLLKVVPNMGAETANLLIDILELPVDIYSAVARDEGDVGGFGANIAEQRFPRVPELEYSNPNMGYVDKTAAFLVGSPLAFIKGLNLLANKSPKAYKAMREMYPYSVGQMHDSFKTKGFIKGLADIVPKPETSEALARNLVLIGATGLGGMYSSGDPANKPQAVDMPVEEVDDTITIDPRDYVGTAMVEDMADAIGKAGAPGLAMGGEPGLETNIFEEDTTVAGGPEEVQVANLFGKAPMWAIGNVPKWKMLLQDLTKNEKGILDAIKKKIGTKDEVLGETVEDIDIIDTPSGETAVGAVKSKKTIIDSPELNESVFYSNLEARLMDPNTPKTFKSADDFYAFLQNKQISKPELEDNILNRYVEISGKNKTPLVTSDMLEIVRQSPMRHIDSVTYGDAAYGGTKSAKYPGYQETGAIPGSYREDVLYVPAEKIPLDPGTIPGTTHDFTEQFVIGWSRLTDRKATLPVDTIKKGIEETIDPKMINTLKRNQKKLDRQLKGLEFSALRKLEREGLVELDDIDNLTMAEVRNILDTDVMARLRSIDEPLEQQILQFRMKMNSDAAKLQNMEAATKGQQVTVTFADEIQSDILQSAKRLEEKFKEQLGDLMDKNIDFVKEQIRSSQRTYRGDFRDINPEVAEYFLRNKTVFRPIFQSETEMQQFMNEYAKTQIVLEDLAKAGLRPDKQLVIKAREARNKQHKMLQDLETAMSQESLQKLFPNVPFKNRMEWGSALVKRDLAKAADRLYGPNKVEGAAEWYAISPAKLIQKRYNQSGGTSIPVDQRTKDMKGIGTEEFYGGPDSVDSKGKHYTSTLEKILKTAAKENNSEIKIIKVDGVGDSFAIKITPEMLLPHKTHRKKGGMVYTPELIDIFEAA